MPISNSYYLDNMALMSQFKDGYFDLGLVDPPWGINAAKMDMGLGKKKWKKSDWDSAPPPAEYFTELIRVTKNQIIWGGNYFTDKLPVSRGWIFWDKDVQPGLSFASGELAWSSFDCVIKKAAIEYSGFRGDEPGGKVHPTQKPIKLYRWLLHNYAKPGDKILDTHLGSQSSRIAAYQMGFDFWGCDIDKKHFDDGEKRFKLFTSQKVLF